MLPVPFEVVPSTVNTLLPAFLQVLKAAGEYLLRNACELHRAPAWIASIFSCRRFLAFFQSWKQKKKSHGERSGEYEGCGSTVTLCLVRNLETLRAVCGLALSCNRVHCPDAHGSGRRRRSGQDDDVEVPRACAWVRRCELLVDRFPLRDKFVMNSTPGVEKNDYHRLCCRWLGPHFLWRWSTRWPPFGALPLGLRVVLETPWFILGNDTLMNVASFCASCNKAAQIEARTSFWSWVSACGSSLALSFRLPKSSRRIWWQVDLLINRASANMRTVTVWSSLIMSVMWTTLSSFRELEGQPDLVSSSTDTLPKTNCLCHPNTHAQDKASSP